MSNRLVAWMSGVAAAIAAIGGAAAIAVADNTNNGALPAWEPSVTWQDPYLSYDLRRYMPRAGTLDAVRLDADVRVINIERRS